MFGGWNLNPEDRELEKLACDVSLLCCPSGPPMALGNLPVISLSDTLPRDLRVTRGTWIRSHSHSAEVQEGQNPGGGRVTLGGLEEARHVVNILPDHGGRNAQAAGVTVGLWGLKAVSHRGTGRKPRNERSQGVE